VGFEMTKKTIAAFGVALVLVFTIGWFMGDSSAINRVQASLAKGSPNPVSAPAVVDPVPANPMTWSAYRASRPKTDTRMALTAKLSDYYNYDYTNLVDSYWSVEFIDIKSGDSAETYGYVKKDTPDGKQLFDILQDGKPHNLILDSKYKINDGSNTVEITKFVKEIK
jgi:hypothetical protein